MENDLIIECFLVGDFFPLLKDKKNKSGEASSLN